MVNIGEFGGSDEAIFSIFSKFSSFSSKTKDEFFYSKDFLYMLGDASLESGPNDLAECSVAVFYAFFDESSSFWQADLSI